MRFPLVVSISISFLLVGGCAGDGSPPPEANRPASVAEDLFKQYGPDEPPDRKDDPVQFWYWRVDEMFRTRDLNADGKIARGEFTGIGMEFKKIDKNEDDFLTKKELIDHVTITYIELLESPSE